MQINNEHGNRVVKLSEPLPCGVWAGPGGETCGRPARAAYLDPDPEDAGAWKLRPICFGCAAAAVQLYEEGSDGND